MAHFLPPEHVRQVNKLEWPYLFINVFIHHLLLIFHSPNIFPQILAKILA